MISAFVLSVAISTTSAPPGGAVVNHAHPAHSAQPTIRVFERRATDSLRELAWITYCHELDQLWLAYRAAGSTPAAWRQYVDAGGRRSAATSMAIRISRQSSMTSFGSDADDGDSSAIRRRN